MNQQFKLLFFILFAVLLFQSCSEDESEMIEPTLEDRSSELKSGFSNIEDRNLFEYARLLSIACEKNPDLLGVLENKALKLAKQGYYETEFFVGQERSILNRSLDNRTLDNLLIDVGTRKTKEFLEDIDNNNPYLSILLIGQQVRKGYEKRIYIDNGFDDQDKNSIVYYYENGILGYTSISNEPLSKAFIVRNSEADPKVTNARDIETIELFKNANGKPIKVIRNAFPLTNNSRMPCPWWCQIVGCTWCDDGDDPGDTGGGSGNNCTEPCERDCEDDTENLYRFRTENDYDGGFRGRGEWFFLIIYADDINYTLQNGNVNIMGNPLGFTRTGVVTGVRDNNSWYTPNFSSIIWDRDDDGDRYKIVCYEADGGSTMNINVNIDFDFRGVNFELPLSITINDGDDEIGEFNVDYCQDIAPNGFIYHPAAVVDVELNER